MLQLRKGTLCESTATLHNIGKALSIQKIIGLYILVTLSLKATTTCTSLIMLAGKESTHIRQHCCSAYRETLVASMDNTGFPLKESMHCLKHSYIKNWSDPYTRLSWLTQNNVPRDLLSPIEKLASRESLFPVKNWENNPPQSTCLNPQKFQSYREAFHETRELFMHSEVVSYVRADPKAHHHFIESKKIFFQKQESFILWCAQHTDSAWPSKSSAVPASTRKIIAQTSQRIWRLQQNPFGIVLEGYTSSQSSILPTVWLEGIAQGKLIHNMPLPQSWDAEDIGGPNVYGSFSFFEGV